MKVTIEMTKDTFDKYVTETLGSSARKINSELQLYIAEGNHGGNILTVPVLKIEITNIEK